MAQITLYGKTGAVLSTTSAGHSHGPSLTADADYDACVLTQGDLYSFDGSSETLIVSSLVSYRQLAGYSEYGERTTFANWTPGATVDLSGAAVKLRLKAFWEVLSDTYGSFSRTDSYTDDTGGRGILQTTQMTCVLGALCDTTEGYNPYMYPCLGDTITLNPTFSDPATAHNPLPSFLRM